MLFWQIWSLLLVLRILYLVKLIDKRTKLKKMLLMLILTNLLVGILAVCVCNERYVKYISFLLSIISFFFLPPFLLILITI